MGQRLVESTQRHREDPPLQLSSSFIMQAEEQQTWKIKVQAKAENFDFKYKSTQTLPSWKFHRLSISLRLRRFFLRVNSESTAHQKKKTNSVFTAVVPRRRQQQQQKQTLKSKLFIFFKKFRIGRKKKGHIAVNKLANPRYAGAESAVNRLKRFAYKELVSVGSLVTRALGFPLESVTSKHKKAVILVILLLVLVAALTSQALAVENLRDYIGKAWNYGEKII